MRGQNCTPLNILMSSRLMYSAIQAARSALQLGALGRSSSQNTQFEIGGFQASSPLVLLRDSDSIPVHMQFDREFIDFKIRRISQP
jgi:hypothetical protein